MGERINIWDVKYFIYTWFRKITEKAEQGELLEMLIDNGLNMEFPGSPLKSHNDFKKWLGDVKNLFFDQVHEVMMMDIAINNNDIDVELIVNWQAHIWKAPAPFSEFIDQDIHQSWKILITNDQNNYKGLKIRDYFVKESPDNKMHKSYINL